MNVTTRCGAWVLLVTVAVIMTNGDAGENVINELFSAIGRAYG